MFAFRNRAAGSVEQHLHCRASVRGPLGPVRPLLGKQDNVIGRAFA